MIWDNRVLMVREGVFASSCKHATPTPTSNSEHSTFQPEKTPHVVLNCCERQQKTPNTEA
jgi:hypothetical protein